jgi:hypothetical protein
MELRILRAPCQRCGQYHDDTPAPVPAPGPKPLSAMEGLKLAADGFREITRRTVPDPPDLGEWIRAARGGAR